MDGAEVQICRTRTDMSAVVGAYVNGVAEVEPDEDARKRVFVRRLGET